MHLFFVGCDVLPQALKDFFVTGCGIGVTVRVGQVLPSDPDRARLIATSSLILIAILGTIVGVGLYIFQSFVVGIFTNDEAVHAACRRIWPFVCCQMLLEFVFGIQSAILRALAMQWRLGVCITCVLWFVLLPTILWVAVKDNGGLVAQWTLLPMGYFVMQIVLRLAYHNVDWKEKSFQVRQQTETRSAALDSTLVDEKTFLLIRDESVASA